MGTVNVNSKAVYPRLADILPAPAIQATLAPLTDAERSGTVRAAQRLLRKPTEAMAVYLLYKEE